jgi:hypothetical protein
VLPAACAGDGFTTPHSARSREVEKASRGEARAVFHHVVAVEHERLDLGEQRMVAVHVTPSGLHHADACVAEMRHAGTNEIGLRKKVGVENGDELAARARQACLERARLVTDTVRAM